MSWTFIPSKSAQVSECLVKDCEPGSPTWAARIAPLHTLSGKHTPPASWLRAWKKAPWMRHLSGPTYSPSTAQLGVAQWIASLRASRAKTCHSPADAQGSTAHAPACSSISSILPTLAVRDACFWRTSQASLLPPPPLWTKPKGLSTSARPPASWENWPTAGGMRNGSLFQRPTWVPVMAGRGGSAGPGDNWTPPTALERSGQGERNSALTLDVKMWLTPNVPNGGRSVSPELVASKGMTEDGQKRTVGLESQPRYWPTPQVGTGDNSHGQISGDFRNRMEEILVSWPTPRANDAEKRGQVSMREFPELVSAAQHWPTPAARDSKGPNSEQHATVTGGGQEAYGSTSQLCGLFAPGPADPRWAGILGGNPQLAPALEPAFRGVVNGLAFNMDDCRAARLKCVGNGVVALCAATAVVQLIRRAGFMKQTQTARHEVAELETA